MIKVTPGLLIFWPLVYPTINTYVNVSVNDVCKYRDKKNTRIVYNFLSHHHMDNAMVDRLGIEDLKLSASGPRYTREDKGSTSRRRFVERETTWKSGTIRRPKEQAFETIARYGISSNPRNLLGPTFREIESSTERNHKTNDVLLSILASLVERDTSPARPNIVSLVFNLALDPPTIRCYELLSNEKSWNGIDLNVNPE